MRPGQAERRAQVYVRRHESIFAVLDVAAVTGKRFQRRLVYAEFGRLLDLIERTPTDLDVHVVLDNHPKGGVRRLAVTPES